ncbi:MAG: hypothetical protein MJ055_04875 [Phascolarctobacterium sp.]|nr:hypothetical protein [Phascolarctobacterium sp.]
MTMNIVMQLLNFLTGWLDTEFYIDGIPVSYLEIFIGVSMLCMVFFVARHFTKED